MTYFMDNNIDDPVNEYFVELIQENITTNEFSDTLSEKYLGWYRVVIPIHVTNYPYTPNGIKSWLKDTQRIQYGKYKLVDWKSSKTTCYIILFENPIDVVKFNLQYDYAILS